MDRAAIEQIVRDWLDAFVEANPELAWLKDAQLRAEPAFLTAATTQDGDDYKAGAVPITLISDHTLDNRAIDKLHDCVVADRTLGGRTKRAVFERPRSTGQVGVIVVIPR
jgi:hypothetical protein